MANNYRHKRKAFLGAIIGAGISTIGNLVGGAIQKRKQEQQRIRQEATERKKTSAQETTSAMNSQLENLNDYRDAFTDQMMKCGGRYKSRKKANFGTEMLNAVPGIIGGIGSIIEGSMGGTGAVSSSVSNFAGAATAVTQEAIKKRNEELANKRKEKAASLSTPTQLKSEVVGPALGPSPLPTNIPHMVTATTVTHGKVPNSSNVVGENADNMQMLFGGKRRRCRYGKKC